MDIISVLTEKLKLLMTEHQIRAAPLARRAQLNESAVRDILRGRSKNPGIVTLQKIAGVMNLRPSALFEQGRRWPILGQLEAGGQLNRVSDSEIESGFVENPFLTLLNEPFSVVLVRGAAAAPLAYDGDFLVLEEPTDAPDIAHFGRPALCEITGVGELLGVPHLSASGDAFHLAPLNPFGAGHRDVRITRASQVVCALPARFFEMAPTPTHTGTLTVHEKNATYAPPTERG